MGVKRTKLPSGKIVEYEVPDTAPTTVKDDAPPLHHYYVQRSEGLLFRTTDLNLFEKKVELTIESGEEEGNRIWVDYSVFTAGELELVGPASKQRLPSEDR